MADAPKTHAGPSVVGANERARAAMSVEIFLRLLGHARECFPDDDLETIFIYLTVISASVSRHLRDPDLLADLGSNPMPQVMKRPTSARAVAASTGIPRETVRRKLRLLVDSGRLVEGPEGFRGPMDTLRKGHNQEFSRRLAAELLAADRRLKKFEDA